MDSDYDKEINASREEEMSKKDREIEEMRKRLVKNFPNLPTHSRGQHWTSSQSQCS